MSGGYELLNKPGISVGVVITKDDKYLLGRRHPKITGGDYWCLPMGKLEWQETFLECARREVREESGIEVLEVEPIALANVILPGSHYLTLGFLATIWHGEPVISAPNEIVEWNWFSIGDFPEPMFKPSKEIIDTLFMQGTFSLNAILDVIDNSIK